MALSFCHWRYMYRQLRCLHATASFHHGGPGRFKSYENTAPKQTEQITTLPGHFSHCKLEDEAVLYIHWPYCARRCTYCNFNKYISDDVPHTRMKHCLVTETENLLHLSQVKKINSIFFGGGTPSLAQPETIADVIGTVQIHCDLPQDAEVTLEVNPTILEMQRLRDFKSAGVNRVSIGAQSLSDPHLKLLGRQHSVNDSVRSLECARELFPNRTSVDVMFGIPGQTVQDWKKDLTRLLTICDSHLSLYQLTLERGTALFKQVQEGHVALPDADVMAEMYEAAVEILRENGFHRYEVSNFAREGAESCHNQAYWQGKQYIGVGPGAHGRFIPYGSGVKQREARIQTLEPEPWMWEVEQKGHATRKATVLFPLDIMEERLMLGMRMSSGISSESWESVSGGVSLESIFPSHHQVQFLLSEALLELDSRGMRATSKGLNVLDSMLPTLMVVLQGEVKNFTSAFSKR